MSERECLARCSNMYGRQQLVRLFLMAIIVLSGSLGVPQASATQYQEVTCQSSNPRNTPVWKNFWEFVNQEYGHGRKLQGEALAVASGHALGRVALAQHDVLERQQAVACLQRGLDQIYTQARLHYGATNETEAAYEVRRLHRLMGESARGEHDGLVKRHTGVTSTSPAYAVLGATAPPPKPVWQPPVTPTPIYPVNPPGPPPNPQVPPEIGYCKQGVYSGFSVEKARRLIDEANRIRLPRECYNSDEFLVCREVSSLLHSAIDNLTQVLQVSRSSVGEGCKYCPLEKHRYSELGYLIDRISKDLYQRGYRTPPPANMGWHYSTLEQEPLCKGPPSPGYFSISPVSRADCPKHCDDAAPKCNYAYYVARTRTCSWQDDQTAPNLHALETADIWDRARRRWLTRPGAVPKPAGPVFILDKVVFSKYQAPSDLCKADMTCKHEKRTYPGNRTLTGTETEEYYSIADGSASYRFRESFRTGGQQLSNFSVNFTFDAPPSRLRPGETLQLRTQGNATGYIDGRGLGRSFVYYMKRGGQNNYFDKTPVVLKSGELPRKAGKPNGQLSKSSTTAITIPTSARNDLIIGGKFGTDPGLYVDWVYKEQ